MAQLYVNGKALTQSVDAMTNYNTAFSNAAHGLVIGGVSILGGAALGRVIGALRGVVGSLFGTSATVIETTGSALPVGDEPYSGPNGMQDGGGRIRLARIAPAPILVMLRTSSDPVAPSSCLPM